VAHGADDDRVVHATRLQLLQQRRLVEAVGEVLLDHPLVGKRLDAFVDLDEWRARREHGSIRLR
jgi:hypothetical protein